ncbi:hypothetical protein [Flavobacterium panacagri]|uniref:hypothetical protein n=1 Tax=Flavobacterium panacagri TaxID=3034146 RepID=UPI0025A61B62|nr:hypothetical protein [Flavobacterium panacagri]
MFKRRLKADFDFFEKSFFDTDEDKIKQYDRIVYVVYDKQELLGFLQENKSANVLVCLFDKQFFTSLSFLERISSLILFDECKTSREIFKEIKTFFKKKLDSRNEAISFQQAAITMQTSFPEYYKAMYYLM